MDTQQFEFLDYAGSPFLGYIRTKSFYHLSFLRPGNEAILGDMIALESDLQQHPDRWEYLCKVAAHSLPWPSTKHDFIIYTLIAFGPNWLLCAFLDREPLFRRLERRCGSNPLVYTACFHAIDHARTLLSRGASLHTSGWLVNDSRQVLPLVAAVQAGDRSNEILDLFLEWRSSVPPGVFQDLVSNPSSVTLPIIRRLLQTDEFVKWLERHRDQHFLLISFIPVESSLNDEQDFINTLWRLVQVGLDPRIPDSSGKTVFHLASARGYLSVMEYLLSVGVRLPNNILNFVLERGESSIQTPSTIRYLLEVGVDVHFRTPAGDTALHTAIKNWTTPLQSPFYPTSENDLADIVKTLVRSGLDPNSRNVENYTPLHLAITRGHIFVVEYLCVVTNPLPVDLMDAVLLAPPSPREKIKSILMETYGRVQL